jgi:preprotein translocase subunit Sec61beta
MVKGKRSGKEKKSKKKTGRGRDERSGLMSSAGLMKYYDVEESAVKISPKMIVLIGAFIAVMILGLEIYYHVWPA